MIFGYPKMLEKISQTPFSSSFLRAGNFPMYAEGSGAVLVDYNYFVINNATKNQALAVDLMKYFASEAGQKAYLENVPYTFPSRLSLLQARLEEPLKD
jgi:ABC-type glycerol-3-phosphate transport system substrate-binding protein